MRIPIPVVVLFCLGVIGGVWWHGTRDHDFLTLPPESGLLAIREKVSSPLPREDHPEGGIATAVEEPLPMTEPAIGLGDFQKPPTLAEYRDDAAKGAGYLSELAALLEAAGQPQRALLALERVIDSTSADEVQTHAAIAAIRRLRSGLSDWNADPQAAISITLQAGTGKSNAVILQPILEEIARDLGSASSGILTVSAKVASGSDIPSTFGPPPVALWFAGPAENSRSTEVLSFTAESPESLRTDVLDTLCQLLRGYLARTASLTIPAFIPDGGDTAGLLKCHITRLSWQELGSRLNQPPP